ncbi:hypothetical protein SAMN05920897_12313 [Alkalispirochaeta americana]|uniref:Uncharacterized protein n=1 Tax=Alkalispirochaeta americana TaxID=159291 RepID=A0A1N6XE40_9SPIO|nr:hypothetical protein SAMN05920897_12313 [Alkalispirochaeta americana]
MPRYSAQFRNSVLKKLLLPEGRSARGAKQKMEMETANYLDQPGALPSPDQRRAGEEDNSLRCPGPGGRYSSISIMFR